MDDPDQEPTRSQMLIAKAIVSVVTVACYVAFSNAVLHEPVRFFEAVMFTTLLFNSINW